MNSAIFIESKDLPSNLQGIESLPDGYEHLYLVYRDNNQQEFVIRGGPQGLNFDSSDVIFGDIVAQVNYPLSSSDDARNGQSPQQRNQIPLNLNGRQPIDVWYVMAQQARNIHDAGIDYNLYFDAQNSNSLVASVLDSVGIDATSPINLPARRNVSYFPGVTNALKSLSRNLVGTDNTDYLRGGDANDNLSGQGGNDRLEGKGGDDFLEGGWGEDIAIFSEEFENYDIEYPDNGTSVIVSHKRGSRIDGVDTLNNIERGQFKGSFQSFTIKNTPSISIQSQVSLQENIDLNNHGNFSVSSTSVDFSPYIYPNAGRSVPLIRPEKQFFPLATLSYQNKTSPRNEQFTSRSQGSFTISLDLTMNDGFNTLSFDIPDIQRAIYLLVRPNLEGDEENSDIFALQDVPSALNSPWWSYTNPVNGQENQLSPFILTYGWLLPGGPKEDVTLEDFIKPSISVKEGETLEVTLYGRVHTVDPFSPEQFFPKETTVPQAYPALIPADFNPATYLASYADLIAAFSYDLNAATQHYQAYGQAEGRTITFEADDYLASYPDLILAFGYNLEAATRHYIEYGASEGRTKDQFNEVAYLSNHTDLQTAFGQDYGLATQHYINYGFFENRLA